MAFVEGVDHLAAVRSGSLQGVREASWEIPQVTLFHVRDIGSARFIERRHAAVAVRQVGPLGKLMPMHLADAARGQSHVDPGDSVGNREIRLRHLTRPAAIWINHAGDVCEGVRKFERRDRQVIGVREAADRTCRHVSLSGLGPDDPEALQALGWPECIEIVELRNRLSAERQCHPRLLGGRENVDVGWTEIWVVHGADADEPDSGTCLRVVAPNRDIAGRAAGNLLTLATRRRRHDDFGLTGGVHDTIGLIERVESMRGPGLALAPTAMVSMDNQWRSNQSISDLPAGAPAFHIRLHRGYVRSSLRSE